MPGPIPYAQFYAALQKHFPGRFTGGAAQTMDALLEDFPELDGILDPNTKGSELLVGPDTPAPKAGPVGGVSGLPPVSPYGRQTTLKEDVGLLGARVIPALTGAAVGGAVGGPVGAAVLGAYGAFGGEYAGESYEAGTGVAPLSPTNVAVQTGIGAIPFTKAAGAVKGIGPLVARAGKSIGGRVALTGAEGAAQGLLSTEADVRLRQDRAPSMGERAFGAGLGGVFGAGVGGAAEGIQSVRSMRAKGKLGYDQRIEVDRIFGGLEEMASAGQLTPDVRKQILTQVEPLLNELVDPLHQQASLERLGNLFQQAHQDDLRKLSADFIADFQKKQATTGLYERTQIAQAFVNSLRDVQADADTVDETIKMLAALTPGNEPPIGGRLALPPASDAAVGPRQGPFYGAPPEGPQFVNRPDSELPIDRTLPPNPEGAPLPTEVERVGDAMERGLEQPPGPPRLIRRPDVARDLRPGAGVLSPEFTPQPAIQPKLKGLRAKEKGVQGPAEQPPLEGAELPLRAEGQIENLPRVRKGEITPDRAFLLHWLASDLEQGKPEQNAGGTVPSIDKTNVRKEDEDAYVKQQIANGVNTGWSESGTHVLFGLNALGANEDRPVIAQRIRDYLSGKSRKPTKSVQAALKMVDAWEVAYDPATGKFDWSKVTTPLPAAKNIHGENVDKFGGHDPSAEFNNLFQGGGYKPRIAADMAFDPPGWTQEPRWLVEKYAPHYLAPEEIRPRFSHQLTKPPQEAQGFLSLLEDQELLDHYGDAIKYGDTEPVAIGWLMHEIERRGLRDFRQPGLETEGPGSPARRNFPREIAEQPGLFEVPLPENATPQLEAPDFSLTPEIAQGSKGVQGGLFSAEPPKFGEQPAYTGPERRTVIPDAERRPFTPEERDAYERRLTAEAMKEQYPKAFREDPGPPKFPSLKSEKGAVGTGPTKAKATRNLVFQNQALKDLQDVAKAGAGREVAGILLGRPDGGVTKVVAMKNVADTPKTHFALDPVDLARVMKGARSEGLEVLATYHTQPTGSAELSKLDKRGAVADIPWVVMGMDGGDVTEWKIWQPTGRPTSETGVNRWSEGTLGVATLRDPNTPPVFQDIKDVSQFVRSIPRIRSSINDAPGLSAWLEKNSAKYAGEAWFVDVQRLLDAGQTQQAWVRASGVAMQGEKAARLGIKGMADGQKEAVNLVDSFVRGGAQDPVGSLYALFDGRTINVPGVGRMVVGPEIPPSLHGTDVFTGAGGVIRPGDRKNKLVGKWTDGTLGTEIATRVLEDVDAELILKDPTGAVKLVHQITEQVLMSPSNFKAVKALVDSGQMTALEAAQQYSHSISDAARKLGALGNWAQKHSSDIKTIEGIRGASGEVEDFLIKGKGGRVIGKMSELTADQTFDALVKPTRAWDRVMLLNDLTKDKPAGTPTLLEQASRGFMLSSFATAMRNLEAAGMRYSAEMLDIGMEAFAYKIGGQTDKARAAYLRAAERAKIPYRLKADHTWVSPLSARKLEFEAIIDSVRGSSGDILRLAESINPEGQHLLGSVAFGEPTPHGRSKYGIVNDLLSPKVQNTLGMWNRSQEFTVRSSIYVAEMRAAYRTAGIDPDALKGMSAEAIAEKVGGMEALQSIHHNAVSQALDFSFSGDLMKGSLAKHVIDFLNKPLDGGGRPGTLIRAGFPFPRFNWSAAPRFIWDHSLIGLALDPLYGKMTGRGRYALGTRATDYELTKIPEMTRKITAAQEKQGNALLAHWELGRRLQTYRKMVNRAERQVSLLGKEPSLPGIDQKMKAASRSLDLLRAERNALTGKREAAGIEMKKAESDVRDLQAQKATLQDVVKQAQSVNAPRTFEQLLARNIFGGGSMLGAAYLMRYTQDGDTPWYIVKVPKPYGDPDEHLELDFRPFAPFAQYLFVADSLKELVERVDWTGENGWWADIEANGISDPIEAMDRIYDHYEGKYTKSSFGAELGQAFLSMSQAAGTTLALVDMFTDIPQQGIPDIAKIGETAARVMGTFAARFTIPFAQFKSVSDLVSDDESKARIAPWSKDESLLTNTAMQLMQPVGNLPFLGAMLIPDTVNQITGKPLDTYAPLMRALTGITARERTSLQDTLTEAGVAPASIYLRDTGDPFLDRLLGFHYANTLGRALPQILEDPDFARLTTPAQRRDYLQAVLPKLKASAIGEALEDTDPEQLQSARETREGRRRRLRMERLQKLIDQEGLRPTETEPDAEPPSEPEPVADEPPAFEGSAGAVPPAY